MDVASHKDRDVALALIKEVEDQVKKHGENILLSYSKDRVSILSFLGPNPRRGWRRVATGESANPWARPGQTHVNPRSG